MTARSPTMVTLRDTQFVESRWWNDGWTVKTVVTWRSSASMIPALEIDPRFPLGTLSRSCHASDFKLALQWIPCLSPAVTGSALGLAGPVAVYCG